MDSQNYKVKIRQATPEDAGFIEQMAYEASFPEGMNDRPTFQAAREIEWFPHYSEEWGQRTGDFGLIAEDESGEALGAVWYRDIGTEAGVPPHELCIALVPKARGHNLGQQLMTSLISNASENGIDRLSLTVRNTNERARKLYDKLGFLTIKESDGYITMSAPTSPLSVK